MPLRRLVNIEKQPPPAPGISGRCHLGEKKEEWGRKTMTFKRERNN
jgi:hypothetical protein